MQSLLKSLVFYKLLIILLPLLSHLIGSTTNLYFFIGSWVQNTPKYKWYKTKPETWNIDVTNERSCQWFKYLCRRYINTWKSRGAFVSNGGNFHSREGRRCGANWECIITGMYCELFIILNLFSRVSVMFIFGRFYFLLTPLTV